MEEEPSATRYKHEPLPDSTTYIRLLEIQGIDSDGHVACFLNAWSVASAPDYYALSYVLRRHISYVLHTDWSLHQIHLGLANSESADPYQRMHLHGRSELRLCSQTGACIQGEPVLLDGCSMHRSEHCTGEESSSWHDGTDICKIKTCVGMCWISY